MNTAQTINYTTRQPLRPLLRTLLVLGLLFPTASARASLEVDGRLEISGTVTTDCVHVNTNGCIIIEAGGTLILTDQGCISIVDGCIILEGSGSELRFTTHSHTVDGSGVIKGEHDSALISIASGITVTCSLNTVGITGHLEIVGDGSFVNEGKVYANSAGGTLEISVASVADTDNGGTVSGINFRWGVNASGGKLLFSNCDETSLVGDFYVHDGTLQVGEDPGGGGDDIDVCTTGDILFNGGSITAGVDDSLRFSGTCP